MHLALVEYEDEVGLILKGIDVDPGRVKWIVLSPYAAVELRKRNITYDTIETHFDDNGLWDATGLNSYYRANQLIRLVDGAIKENVREVGSRQVNVLDCYKYQLVMLFDGIMGRIFMLKGLIDALAPEKIYVCRTKTETTLNPSTPFSQTEQLWGAVLELEGWGPEVIFIDKPEPEPVKEPFSAMKSLKGFIRRHEPLLSLVYAAIDFMKRGVVLSVKNILLRKKILFLEAQYDWEYAATLFIKKKFGIVSKLECKPVEPHSVAVPLPEFRDDYIRLFSICGVDFYPMVKGRIEQMLQQGIGLVIRTYGETEQYLKRHNIKAIAASVLHRGAPWIFIQAAKGLGIPVFLWPHGYDSTDRRKLSGEELLYTDYLFLHGEGHRELYTPLFNEYDFSIVPVGTERLFKLGGRKPPESRYVLYATTHYYQNNLYFPHRPPSHLPNTIFAIQSVFTDYLNSLKNEDVILKLFPSDPYRVPPLTITNPRIKTIRNEKKFTDLLFDAKAVIVDIVCTLALFEALTTEKPLFVLNKINPLDDGAEALLMKRAIVSRDPYELMKELDGFLKTGSYRADVTNREFLRHYATYLDDGRSAERAVDAVIKTIEGKQE